MTPLLAGSPFFESGTYMMGGVWLGMQAKTLHATPMNALEPDSSLTSVAGDDTVLQREKAS